MTTVLPRTEVGATTFDVAETRLREGFEAMVGDLGLSDIVIPTSYRNPNNIPADRYGLVPITRNPDPQYPARKSALPAGFDCRMPQDVSCVYYNGVQVHNMPHLDTNFGIGLTYQPEESEARRHLVAVTAAGVVQEYWEPDNVYLQVKQLQGLVSNAMQPELAPALRPGWFKVRESLLNAWLEIAPKLGIGTVAVWSVHNNPYAVNAGDAPTRKRFERGYDDVARGMGFVLDDKTKLWLKQVD
ncbi:MAG TPA: hypothetical protein VL737_04315 [Candidatus Pristimantibacillus sp.]|nr:hypothetical protein [Candidatus Pristimantibacillus sp.]